MNKAEEAALKAYSKGPTVNIGYEDYDQYSKERSGFIQGYKQAEKDLALTWEDAKLIYRIADELEREGCIKRDRLIGYKFWSEVVKRFLETKGLDLSN